MACLLVNQLLECLYNIIVSCTLDNDPAKFEHPSDEEPKVERPVVREATANNVHIQRILHRGDTRDQYPDSFHGFHETPSPPGFPPPHRPHLECLRAVDDNASHPGHEGLRQVILGLGFAGVLEVPVDAAPLEGAKAHQHRSQHSDEPFEGLVPVFWPLGQDWEHDEHDGHVELPRDEFIACIGGVETCPSMNNSTHRGNIPVYEAVKLL